MSRFFLYLFSLFILSASAFAVSEIKASTGTGAGTSYRLLEKEIYSGFAEQVQLALAKEDLQQQIDEQQEKIRDRKKLIITRLRAIHRLKNAPWYEFLAQEKLTDTERNIEILKRLNNFDLDIFREYNLALRQLAEARRNLQETDELLRRNTEALKNEQARFAEIENAQIEALKNSGDKSLLLLKGFLSRPLEGSLHKKFGTVSFTASDRRQQFYLLQQGELYLTKPATPVRSVGPGQVIFRDALPGWREALIIRHDGDYYSVYAGVKSLRKKLGMTGDFVEKDELIGSAYGDEFYFELRHSDVPVDPENWYKKF